MQFYLLQNGNIRIRQRQISLVANKLSFTESPSCINSHFTPEETWKTAGVQIVPQCHFNSCAQMAREREAFCPAC